MATWVFHLRVAEKLIDCRGNIDETAYYVGAIAPDSGRMVDKFTYLPDKDTSHWKRDGVSFEQRFEDNADFFRKYGENEKDIFKRSLFLGYYIHILTDTIYVRDIISPFIRENGRPFWRANIDNIRAGWYEIDYRFVHNNPDFHPLRVIDSVESFDNNYFDYFEKDDITERIKFASELYKKSQVHPDTWFVTHDEARAEEMIGYMASEIRKELKEKFNI